VLPPFIDGCGRLFPDLRTIDIEKGNRILTADIALLGNYGPNEFLLERRTRHASQVNQHQPGQLADSVLSWRPGAPIVPAAGPATKTCRTGGCLLPSSSATFF